MLTGFFNGLFNSDVPDASFVPVPEKVMVLPLLLREFMVVQYKYPGEGGGGRASSCLFRVPRSSRTTGLLGALARHGSATSAA